MEVAQESVTAVIQGSDSAAGFADLTGDPPGRAQPFHPDDQPFHPDDGSCHVS